MYSLRKEDWEQPAQSIWLPQPEGRCIVHVRAPDNREVPADDAPDCPHGFRCLGYHPVYPRCKVVEDRGDEELQVTDWGRDCPFVDGEGGDCRCRCPTRVRLFRALGR